MNAVSPSPYTVVTAKRYTMAGAWKRSETCRRQLTKSKSIFAPAKIRQANKRFLRTIKKFAEATPPKRAKRKKLDKARQVDYHNDEGTPATVAPANQTEIIA